MLQQTQVKTVLPRYHDWFSIFPDIQALADAHLDEVLKQWEGLGYYRRARFIHQSAQLIATKFAGQFPKDFAEILKLKGVGRSTAGAISSFCYQTATPVLDGNVKRVLSAWHKQPYTDKQLWLIAQQWIDKTAEPDLWNQAMMELGATCCQARNRRCEACPVATACNSAFTSPEKRASSLKVADLFWQVNLHRCERQGIWLQQRPAHGIWAGLWTPPITVLENKPESQVDLIHQLTHRRLHLYLNYLKPEATPPNGDGRWVKSVQDLAIPTGIQRLLARKEVTYDQ